MTQTFADHLKSWRDKRRLSQLQLATLSEVSSRHIAFLETGRAQPSRAMVLRLARYLDVPLVERNGWLTAAGFSAQYKAHAFDSVDMAPVAAALLHIMERHEPYPAFAIDRHWTLAKVNRAAGGLLGALGLGIGDSILDTLADPARIAALFENGDEVRAHFAHRLRTESAHYGGDPVLDRAAERISAGLDPEHVEPATAVIPVRLRSPEGPLSIMTILASFGATGDMALAELRIELMFPADDRTRAWFTSQAGAA